MKLWIPLGLALSLIGTSAPAAGLPKEVTGYRDITVAFSEGAKNCNIKDEALYSDRLRDKLGEIGIKENSESILVAHLAISAKSFGVLNAECVSQVSMNFQTTLTAENIVTDNEAVRHAIDRLKAFPVVVYQTGMFGVQTQQEPSGGGESTRASETVLTMIDDMVKKFDSER